MTASVRRSVLLIALFVCGCNGATRVAPSPQLSERVTAESPAETAAVPATADQTDPRREAVPTAFSPMSSSSPEERRSLDEMLLFQPTKLPADRVLLAPLPFTDVIVAAEDGTQVRGWWAEHRAPEAIVLYLHGNAGNLWSVKEFLRWLHERADCSVFAVDYRGYGLSDGVPTVEGVLQDVRAARAELVRRSGAPATETVLIGRSLGGALAIQSTAETPPRGLVLESTFTSLEEVARVHVSKLSLLVPQGRLDSLATLAGYQGPLLHSHGDADRVIPYAQGERLHAVAAGPKQFITIRGGDHNDPPPAEYLHALRAFLRTLP